MDIIKLVITMGHLECVSILSAQRQKRAALPTSFHPYWSRVSPKDVNPSQCICVSAQQIPADSQVIREVQARRSNKFMIQLRQEPLSVYFWTQLFAAGKVGIKGGLRGHEMKSKKCLICLQSLGREAWLEERLKLYMSDNRIFLKIRAVWCCQQRQKLLGEEDISVGFSW